MYEDDKNLNNQTGINPYTNQGTNGYTDQQNTQQTYGQGAYSGQSTYGIQNSNASQSNTYGSTNSYGGQNSTGYSGQGSYGTGSGTGYGSGYSYGQNRYSYQNGQQTYGTYQYSASGSGPVTPPEAAPKKKHVAGKVVAAVCAVALVVGGGAGSYALLRSSGSALPKVTFEHKIESQIETPEEKPETTAQSEKEEPADTAESTAKATSEKNDIQTTTVTGETKAVVTDVTAVVEEVMPAMVMIHNNYTASANYFGYMQSQEATASGSGIIVGENDSELLIATNYHVIEGADSLEVIFEDESTVQAVVKGTDSHNDLAVIAVMLDDISTDTKDSIRIATLGDSNALKLGEPAIAIGNALGYGQSVTTGVISALNREVEMYEGDDQVFIQTDAAINPGNSGGALLNLQGEVIGINSNKIGGDTIEGMGYAIPISVAKPIIDKLMNEQTMIKVSSTDRGFIGISGVSVTAEVSAGYGIPQGVYVAEITDGGGAEAAGLLKGDVITEFEGQEITSMDDLQNKLQYYSAGTTVNVKVMRQDGTDYKEISYDVTLRNSYGKTGGADTNAAEEQEQGG